MDLMLMMPIVYMIVFTAITLFVIISLIRKDKKLKVFLALWVILIITPAALFYVNPDVFNKMGLGEILKKITNPKGAAKEEPVVTGAKEEGLAKKVKKLSPADTGPGTTDEAGRQTSIELVEKARALWKADELTDPNLALDLLNQAVSADPNFAVAFNDRGRVHAKIGQYDQALKDYDAAIKLDSAYVKAYSNRGVVLYETDRYEEALKDLNRAIVLNPGYATAYLNRGLVNYQMDRTENACKDFKKACELGDCAGSDWAKKNGTCK